MMKEKRGYKRRKSIRRQNIVEGPETLQTIFGIQKERRLKNRRNAIRRSNLFPHSLVNDIIIVTASRDLDLDFENNLHKKLKWVLSSGISNIILDLSDSVAIVESQIKCISDIQRKCLDVGGNLFLAGVGEIVENALYYSEYTDNFVKYPTVEDAVKAFETAT